MRILLLGLGLLAWAGTVLRGDTPVTEVHYLSGRGSDDARLWDFYCTGGRNSGVWTKIAVPSCWEQQGFGTYEYGVEARPNPKLAVQIPQADEQGIYRHQFDVPAHWQGRVVRIVFQGVMTDAAVSLNGQSAGPVHQGSFYAFKYDITDKLRFGGKNELEVRVSKYSANPTVNRAERVADYWNFGGIFRPVYLEVAPAEFLERVAIDARADGVFRAQVFLGGARPAGTEVQLRLKTREGVPVGEAVTQAVAAEARTLELATLLPEPRTWTAETPHLYVAEFVLRRGGQERHRLTQRFGFRTIEVRAGDGIYLNGAKITLKGVNRHSFWPDTGRTLSYERQRADVRLIKEANMNAVRMSHYPPDPEFLDLCDEAGLYVLNELAGWQGGYDTATGKRLIGQLVQRDVNHPSILFWNNGNEGGENEQNDDEFARHDPQKRQVVHPWAESFRGLNTKHYRDYAETVKMAEGPDIFMPTEFLHGLFDGGGGAGLDDYWKVMGEKPRAAGGFLWVLADEGIKRTDEQGRIDPRRDLGPDGLVGPYHEKEGSFHTVREVWSPVQIPWKALPPDFAGELPVRNRYDFRNLNAVTFEWRLMKFAPPGALLFHRTLLAYDRFAGPDLAARKEGILKLALPADWRDADVLMLTASDAERRELLTWTWQWKHGAASIGIAQETKAIPTMAETAAEIMLTSGRNGARFDKATGQLLGLQRDGRTVSLSGGPRVVAYRSNARVLVPVELPVAKAYQVTTNAAGDTVRLTASSDGALRRAEWTLFANGDLRLDYELAAPGVVELFGIDFDYPEEKMKSKEWFGAGPYRVWQNRLKGTQIARWETEYNDPIPGMSWQYPEFKGWFADWRWVAYTTTEGRFALLNEAGQAFFGAYSPRDGKNNPVIVLPRTGLGVYQVIPAIGSKTATPEKTGPQGQPQNLTQPVRGAVIIRLLDRP